MPGVCDGDGDVDCWVRIFSSEQQTKTLLRMLCAHIQYLDTKCCQIYSTLTGQQR